MRNYIVQNEQTKDTMGRSSNCISGEDVSSEFIFLVIDPSFVVRNSSAGFTNVDLAQKKEVTGTITIQK